MQWPGTLRSWQRIEMAGDGGLKKPKPKLGCNATEEEEEKETLQTVMCSL